MKNNSHDSRDSHNSHDSHDFKEVNKKKIFLNTMTIEEAYKKLFDSFDFNSIIRTELIPVSEALGRITADAIFAKISNPHYNASAMDGIAVRSDELAGIDERHPKILREKKDFIVVDTGDVIPKEFDSVVMIEDVFFHKEHEVEIREATFPYEHVRVIGEDIVVGEMLFTTGHKIRPMDIGALISGGISEILVYSKPKVGLIPTGTEIVEVGAELKPGDILDSNSHMFSAIVLESGGIPEIYKPVIDDEKLLEEAIMKAVNENDLVVINAGSSAGREDFTVGLIEKLGTLLLHGLSIKPGRPTILGIINGKPVIGVPGYPVSAYVVFMAFVDPLIRKLANKELVEEEKIEVILTKRIVSSLKHEEFVRMKLGKVGDRLVGTPLNRGAGTTMSLVKADGLLTIPRNSEGYEAGEKVSVSLWKSKKSLNDTLVIIGSHDILIDYVQNALIKKGEDLLISSAHVGSLGGIMAIKRKEAHIAPIHLLDSETGAYNIPAIEKYLHNEKITLIKGIKRQQGLYVSKGNPLGIKGVDDISKNHYIFANRQKGSGTRVLFDYLLKQKNIDSSNIKGYEQELITHTSVALSVLSGNSHVGMGIESVAKLMNLDFIPIGEEDYDFLVPKELINLDQVQIFINFLMSKEFKELLNNLGGYRIEPIEIIELG